MTPKLKDVEEVNLDESIRAKSVTPASILTPDSKGLLSMLSELKLQNTSLKEEC